jgi:hypothetical protein
VWYARGLGAAATTRSVQALPSHSHVWPTKSATDAPPNMTTRWRCSSYASGDASGSESRIRAASCGLALFMQAAATTISGTKRVFVIS